MSSVRAFISSYIGRKILMAITGLLLIGFLIAHMAGNLLIFKGPEAFNHYSDALVKNPLIVMAEIALLIIFIAHLVSGISFTLKNRGARSKRYKKKKWAGGASRKSFSSTTMILTGLVILVFVPLHIFDFKYGPAYPSAGDPGVRDLHRLVLEEFSEPEEVIWYALAMIVIGFHLWHGFGSAFESLGVPYRKGIHRLGHVLAFVIASGFFLIPVILYVRGH